MLKSTVKAKNIEKFYNKSSLKMISSSVRRWHESQVFDDQLFLGHKHIPSDHQEHQENIAPKFELSLSSVSR